MKRREFIRNVSAMAAIPALPVGAINAPPVSAALIAKAEHMAGLWVHTSANMMKNAFGLDQTTANSLFNALLDKQIVAAPNAFGVSKAVMPCYENPLFAAKVDSLLQKARPAPQAVQKPTAEKLKNIVKKVDQLLEDAPTEEEEAAK
jgi:hypothetical protein